MLGSEVKKKKMHVDEHIALKAHAFSKAHLNWVEMCELLCIQLLVFRLVECGKRQGSQVEQFRVSFVLIWKNKISEIQRIPILCSKPVL
jgi:hypothetical protein